MFLSRFKSLLKSTAQPPQPPITGSLNARQRILFILDGVAPTFSISFELPLKKALINKNTSYIVLTQQDLQSHSSASFAHISHYIETYKPTHVIFSRFGGGFAKELFHLARKLNAYTIYHIDDDLFSFPEDMLDVYKKRHMNTDVLSAREFLIKNCDMVYASTPILEDVLKKRFQLQRTFSGIYCPFPGVGHALEWNPTKTLGYMGTKSHMRDLSPLLPLIIDFLTHNSNWQFELFGDLQDVTFPASIKNQILYVPPVRGYENFRQSLNERRWAVAFAPLQKDTFNGVKAPTKFIEYTAMGSVTFATPYGPYLPLIKNHVAYDLDTLSASSLTDILKQHQELQTKHSEARDYCQKHFALSQLEKQLEVVLQIP
ncbi:MAG: hypothetical protein H6623_01170 [Bdellovibrionaceae bacterium]|nr:hypothetical protein [Pseudobdellovibrionaceae bacterium]